VTHAAASPRAATSSPRPTRLVDVAELAGVSLATASRALNHDHTHAVSPSTRERVQAAAAKLAYHVNPTGRGLRVGRLATMAVVVHHLADPYFAEVARAVAARAWEAGMLTIVCSSNRDPEVELRYLQLLSQSRVAAVLFAGGGRENAGHQRMVQRHTDAIAAYGGAVVAMAPHAEHWPCETADNHGGAAAAARHLLSLGHREIAVITGPEWLLTSRERELGFREALAEAGVVPLMAGGDFTPSGGSRAVEALLDQGRRFTAVLASNDGMAIGALQQLQRAGISVPHEVSVMGFDDIPGVDYLSPPLSTVRVPLQALAIAAVERALAILSGAADDLPRVRVHPVLIVDRASTAPPPATAGVKGR
jgi:LacI family transcriptional regulator